jgi:hypothetical protein
MKILLSFSTITPPISTQVMERNCEEFNLSSVKPLNSANAMGCSRQDNGKTIRLKRMWKGMVGGPEKYGISK